MADKPKPEKRTKKFKPYNRHEEPDPRKKPEMGPRKAREAGDYRAPTSEETVARRKGAEIIKKKKKKKNDGGQEGGKP